MLLSPISRLQIGILRRLNAVVDDATRELVLGSGEQQQQQQLRHVALASELQRLLEVLVGADSDARAAAGADACAWSAEAEQARGIYRPGTRVYTALGRVYIPLWAAYIPFAGAGV